MEQSVTAESDDIVAVPRTRGRGPAAVVDGCAAVGAVALVEGVIGAAVGVVVVVVVSGCGCLGAVGGLVPEHVGLVALQHEGVGVGHGERGDVVDVEGVVVGVSRGRAVVVMDAAGGWRGSRCGRGCGRVGGSGDG